MAKDPGIEGSRQGLDRLLNSRGSMYGSAAKFNKSGKHKALQSAKKGSADYINAERKRQGYKPMSAKDKRIHEGMDKFL